MPLSILGGAFVPLLALLHSCSSADEFDDLEASLKCSVNRPEWRDYHAIFDRAARATALDDIEERNHARSALAEALGERTQNVSDVLSCNVGVIAGYYIIARLATPLAVESLGLQGADQGEAGLAYRLLQLALIFIFTLRNANRIPEDAGAAWGVSERSIIPAIMQMKRGHDWQMRQKMRQSVPVAPGFRDPSMRVAIVTICAYPPDHPLALPKVTPSNREEYTRRHDYALRLHLEPPVLGAHGLSVQHAKLATVLAYLQSGDFDWVAWFDCDSMIMNMNRTIDSIIYQYTQQITDDSTRSTDDSEELSVCEEESSLSLSGTWFDSWVVPEFRNEAAVDIRQSSDGVLEASAQQFGVVKGQIDDHELVLEFPDGPVRGSINQEFTHLRWNNGAEWTRPTAEVRACRQPCRAPGPECKVDLDPDVDLLITEEGWGLSSANWLIRRSAWSINFLHSALTAAHVEFDLFGDQDAMILHLMNQQALRAAARDDASLEELGMDPLDRHSTLVPQFELNAYDALNALTMDCDMFVEGDFLVTFPQCKDAESCNDVFELAAKYGSDDTKELEQDAGAWWRREEHTPRWSEYDPRSSAALRVFGPRPVIREAFLREQARNQED